MEETTAADQWRARIPHARTAAMKARDTILRGEITERQGEFSGGWR